MFNGDGKVFTASLRSYQRFFLKALLLVTSAKDQRSVGLWPIPKHPVAHEKKTSGTQGILTSPEIKKVLTLMFCRRVQQSGVGY